MDTTSLWQAVSQTLDCPSLEEHIEVDIAIIGAGITGITTALRLNDGTKRIAILEAHQIGGVTTSASTGNLYVPVQAYFQNIVKKFNKDIAKIIAHSRRYAIDFIENTVNTMGIDCNFSRRPWYIYTNNDNQIDFLKKEVETFKELEIEIGYINEMPLPFKFKLAACMNNQARFNPLQYVLGVAKKLQDNGVFIYENSPVLSVEKNKNFLICTPGGKVSAKILIFATHTPLGIHPIQMYIAPYRSYVVASQTIDKYPEGHFWDLDHPHHATCTHAIDSKQPNVLMVAGSHHKTGQGKETRLHFKELQNFLKTHLSISDFSYQWSAQHFQAADDVPYIGLAHHTEKNSYIATGYFADGLIYGTLAGMIIGDDILKGENSFSNVYDARRSDFISSLPALIKENFNVFLQYLKDYPFISSKEFEDIKIGEGRIVEIDKEKWAISRDDNNQLHIVSAVCTHMKCIVKWNDAEQTWDCPCHGSRFTCRGHVIEGPALQNLRRKAQD